MLLKELTELDGVAGNEDEVRNFIIEKVKLLADDVKVDPLGNVIAYKKGGKSKLKIMLSAHMDEVGFIINGFSDKGSLSFNSIGGIDPRTLLGKKVTVGEKKIPGIIGVKPMHMQGQEERIKNIPYSGLYIDIGVDKKDEVEKLVELGDYVSFVSNYTEFGDGLVKAKALDDRVGCYSLIKILENTYEFDIYCSFTVQEEVGLRGSETAAYQINPDIAIILEGTTCSDVSNVPIYEQSTKLRMGPAITIIDRTAYSDKDLVRLLFEIGKANNITMQAKQTVSGGNDAGKIQRSRGGARVAVISVPCRYIHTPVSVMCKKDLDGGLELLNSVLQETKKLEKLVHSNLEE